MAVTAYSTLASEFQVSISSTLTKVVGVQSITLNPGENTTFESGDLTSDFDEITATGVQSGGSVAFSGTWDPLDATHQALHTHFNAGSLVTGNVQVSETGVDIACTGYLTKFEVKAERKSGWMFDAELKLNDRVTLNEADPV